MFRKIGALFLRDLKVSSRSFISLYVVFFPLIFAAVINVLVPSMNDTTVNVGLLEEDQQAEQYFSQFAHVEVFENRDDLDDRVLQRDDFFGLVKSADNIDIVAEGNESKGSLDYAKWLVSLYRQDVQVSDTSGQIVSLDRTVPPLKKMLINGALMLVAILGGMLIVFNIVEEKTDNTISAIHVTTVPRWAYIVGKSLFGVLFPVVGAVVMLFVSGFTEVDYLQVTIVMLLLSLLSVVVGFIMGLTNDDVMSAAGNLKLLFLPLFAAIAAIELLGESWQWLFYWIPFYWAYKANDIVLSGGSDWPRVLAYCGVVALICAVVIAAGAPRIRKGLE